MPTTGDPLCPCGCGAYLNQCRGAPRAVIIPQETIDRITNQLTEMAATAPTLAELARPRHSIMDRYRARPPLPPEGGDPEVVRDLIRRGIPFTIGADGTLEAVPAVPRVTGIDQGTDLGTRIVGYVAPTPSDGTTVSVDFSTGPWGELTAEERRILDEAGIEDLPQVPSQDDLDRLRSLTARMRGLVEAPDSTPDLPPEVYETLREMFPLVWNGAAWEGGTHPELRDEFRRIQLVGEVVNRILAPDAPEALRAAVTLLFITSNHPADVFEEQLRTIRRYTHLTTAAPEPQPAPEPALSLWERLGEDE